MTNEEAARIVLKIFADKGTTAGQMIMIGALEHAFLTPDGRKVNELEDGVNRGIEQGWLQEAGDGVTLTAAGFAAMKQTG